MRHMRKLIAITLLLALCMSAAALSEDATVTVSGSAQVSVATDHAIIHLGVRTRAETPSEAQKENKQRTDSVMKALTEECGIPEDKIATSSYSIYTMSEWEDIFGREKLYYQVMHQLSVTVADIDKAGAVIDICVEAGANNIDYVSFESSNMKEAYDKALKEAIADAKRKAELIADTTGMQLGDLKSVTTNGSGDVYDNTFRMAEASEDAALGETKLAPGMQNTSAYVTVTWTMTPKAGE